MTSGGPTSCVVTGGARGIGRGIAALLVARGHGVVVSDVDAEAVAATAGEIGAVAGLGARHDVRDPDATLGRRGRGGRHAPLTAWFNNAGVGDDGTLAALTDEQVRRLVEVNLLGTMWGTRAALAALGPRGGDVVNVASLAGLTPAPGYSVYAATKAGVVSLSSSVNAEAPRGVRVHALCPDGADTAMLRAQGPAGGARSWSTRAGRSSPSSRSPRPRFRAARLAPRRAYAAGLARRSGARRRTGPGGVAARRRALRRAGDVERCGRR